MPLWKIAYRSIQHRSLSSLLTAFSLSLGVALVVLVIVILGVISSSFNRGSQGYDLIVGPKGNPLDIVWSTVFYNRAPVGTVPAKYLDDLLYSPEYKDDKGQPLVMEAIPVTIGHHFKMTTIVGTTPEFFSKLTYIDSRNRDRHYEFVKPGKNFGKSDTFAAVVGSTAALNTGLQLGEEFRPAAPGENLDGSDPNLGHAPFKVVGILKPTGTPNDNVIFININGSYDMHGLPANTTGHDADDEGEDDHAGHDHGEHGEGLHNNDYSAILVMAKQWSANPDIDMESVKETGEIDTSKFNRSRTDVAAMALPELINKNIDVQAVSPVREISAFLENVVGNVQLILVLLAVLVVIVAGIGMMVSIYNTMNERRQEIAIMRALGARRITVMMIIMLESVLLSLGGGLFGILIGHVMLTLVSPWVASYSGIILYAWSFHWTELTLIPGLLVLAAFIGYLPAAVAYRQDVATSLKP
ncbi:MAG: ABC transporter permease [Planctomycetaceae bacterium]|nr:ABC transporter permease [Planctomycetaceae bacterium]